MHLALPSGLMFTELKDEWEVIYFFKKNNHLETMWTGGKKKKKMLDKNQMKREKQKRSMRGTLLWDLENPYSGLNLVAGSAAA